MSLNKAGSLLELAEMAAAARRGVTLGQIRERFGVSHRTAQRMTEALVLNFPDVEVATDADDRKRRWRLDRPRICGQVAVSADQLAAIDLAVAALGPATREAAELRRLAEAARSALPPKRLASVEIDHETLLEVQGWTVRPGPRPEVRPDVEAAVVQAFRAMRLVAFDYASGSEVIATPRLVAPYGILSGLRRYLVGQPVDRDGPVRIYRMDKIARVEVRAEIFVRPAGFDLNAFARRGFGSYVAEAEYGDVAWRFLPEAAPRARGFLLHPDQVMEEAEDGCLIVRFKASGLLEMCWFLYAWGDKVEVLVPEALRTMVADHRRSDFEAMP